MDPNWKTDLLKEFERAAEARARRNEGQARVCARRAAGIALREHLRRKGETVYNQNAYELLKDWMDDPDTPADLRQIGVYLTLRVNEEFNLPVAVDLVAEARILCERLLPGEV